MKTRVIQRIWELGWSAGQTKEMLLQAEIALRNLEKAHAEALARVNAEYNALKDEAQARVTDLSESLKAQEKFFRQDIERGIFEFSPGSVWEVIDLIDRGVPNDRKALRATFGEKVSEKTEDRLDHSLIWLRAQKLVQP